MIIGVVGLGTMGLGIAQVFAAAGYRVFATDALEPARASAKSRLRASLEPRVAKGALAQDALDAVLSNLRIVPILQDLSPAALIVEAIVETCPPNEHFLRLLPPAFLCKPSLPPIPRPCRSGPSPKG